MNKTGKNIKKFTLLKLVDASCQGLPDVSASALLGVLTPQDITGISNTDNFALYLREMACTLSLAEHIARGACPMEWNSRAHCDGCGDVFLWAAVSVPSCPWCVAREHGVKIPRPAEVGA